MNYTGYFVDLNRVSHKITIFHDASEGWQDVTLTSEPFTTSMSSETDNIFEPFRCTGATISVLTAGKSDYMNDIYSSGAHDHRVIVTQTDDDSKVEWTGWITPSMYDLGYEYAREELQIDCIDGISSLDYYKWIPDNPESLQLLSLAEIIRRCVKQAGVYDSFYVQKSISIDDVSTFTEDFLSSIHVSEQSFYDTEAEIDQDGNRDNKDDDSYKDVLEKILTSLGMTLFTKGTEVWIIDWDVTRNTERSTIRGQISNPFWKYSNIDSADSMTVSTVSVSNTYLSDDGKYTVIQSNNYTIDKDSYAENGQKISLTKVYNKCSVEDDFDEVEDLMPEMFDNLTEIWPLDSANGYPPQLVQMPDSKWCLYKVFKNNNYSTYSYDSSGNLIDQSKYITDITVEHVPKCDSAWEFGMVLEYGQVPAWPQWAHWKQPALMRWLGQSALFVKSYYWKNEDYAPLNLDSDYTKVLPYFTMDNYLVLCLNESKTSTLPRRKLLECYPSLNPPLVSGNGTTFVVFEGTCIYEDVWGRFGYDNSHERKDDKWTESVTDVNGAHLTCSLEVDGKKWNGSSWVESGSDVTFNIPLSASDHKHYIGKSLKVMNNIPYTWNIDKQGWAVQLPYSSTATDKIKFTMWTPSSPSNKYLRASVWIRDFDMTLHVIGEDNKDVTNSSKNDKTVYTNVIDVEHVEDFDDVEFKLCTYDGKSLSSNVFLVKKNDSTFTYLNRVSHSMLRDLMEEPKARLEELYCAKVVREYTDPKFVLEVTLKANIPLTDLIVEKNLNKTFIINSKEWNAADCCWTYTLVEKN